MEQKPGCCGFSERLHRAAWLLVALLTVGFLISLAVTGVYCVEEELDEYPRLSPKDVSSYYEITVWGFVAATCMSSPVACWLLANSSTSHLRRVADFSAVVWAYTWLFALYQQGLCLGLSGAWIIGLIATGGWCASWVFFVFLMYERCAALEGTFFQSLGTTCLRRALCALAAFAPVAVTIYYLAKRAPAGSAFRLLAPAAFWIELGLALTVISMVSRSFVRVLLLAQQARRSASIRSSEAASRAPAALRLQLVGIVLAMLSGGLAALAEFWKFGLTWPVPGMPEAMQTAGMLAAMDAGFMALDSIVNSFACIALSGAMDGAVRGGLSQLRSEHARRASWRRSSTCWIPQDGPEWQAKVEEIGGRSVTLEVILQFYRKLPEVMPHFDPLRHTTCDVVWGAVIPLSAPSRSSLSEVLMAGHQAEPSKMVTHNWSNLFCHLVAAMVADALDEKEYGMIAYLLINDIDTLVDWIQHAGAGSRSYWVCAFAVNQHLSICSDDPIEWDSVTRQLYPACRCGLPKAHNGTPPLLNGESVPCEMNKFEHMMMWLSAKSASFSQVVAVDESFNIFHRAWAVAELAAAERAGMRQSLKISSDKNLELNREQLMSLDIKEMRASRREDEERILSRIQDPDAFNRRLKDLLLNRLLPSWTSLDAFEQMLQVGRVARWQLLSCRLKSDDVWKAGISIVA